MRRWPRSILDNCEIFKSLTDNGMGVGPPPHRHDFEETLILLEGETEATFRGKKSTVKAGDTINIPANAPHRFHNTTSKATRLHCICSPAGQEEFFASIRNSNYRISHSSSKCEPKRKVRTLAYKPLSDPITGTVDPSEAPTRRRKTEGAPTRNQIAIKESKIIQPKDEVGM